MGNQVSGRPLDPAATGRALTEHGRAISQLQRLMASRPKPAPAASGGIVDIARVETTATFPSFAGIPWPSGTASPNALDTTYSAPTSMVDAGSVSWLTISEGGITPTEDGYYQAWCYVYLKWPSLAAACGSAATLYLNGNDAPDSGMYTVHELPSGKAALTQTLTNGPEWMTTSDTWRFEVDGLAATSADIEVSTALWRITKYGAA